MAETNTEQHKNKLNEIIDDIINKKILLKLKNNLSRYVNGRIIRFSETIKLKCSEAEFDFKVSLENVDRDIMNIVISFFEVVNWKVNSTTFKNYFSELENWLIKNNQFINEVEDLAKYLKLHPISEFIQFYTKSESNLFKTEIDSSTQKFKSSFTGKSEMKDMNQGLLKDFESAYPYEMSNTELSYKIPIEIYQVKLNANKSHIKSKFNIILQDTELDSLIDAMICDSFWFIVISFKINTAKEKNKKPDNNNSILISDILKRLSKNYFNFFIKLCEVDKNGTANNLPSLKVKSKTVSDEFNQKKDEERSFHYHSKINTAVNKNSILDAFHDYMSQCVFYSLYLSFPRSRLNFNYAFKQFLVSFFGYMFNGLSIHIKYNTDHWELDLGTGNIIEEDDSKKKFDQERLPSLIFMEDLIKSKLKSNRKYGCIGKKLETLREKNIDKNPVITNDILNTPLYRMNAENLKFETLNMIKPIKLKQRKTFDTNE